jgi:tetratricopeptide (TPR) repeat protein
MRTVAFAFILAAAVPATILVAQDEPAVKAARAAIDAPVEPNTALARAELYRLINELESISFRDPANPVSGQAVAKGFTARPRGPQGASADTNSVPDKAAAQPKPAVKPKPEVPPIVQDPNTVANPFELAEALYRVRRYKESAACYRIALARASSEEKRDGADADRAWMLFQTGNCYARLDPAEAIKVYRQLMTEHPASEWTPIAIGREQLLQWYIASDIAPTPEKR